MGIPPTDKSVGILPYGLMKFESEEEFKKAILEIGQCLKRLKHGAITPTFQKILDAYKKDISLQDK